MIGAMVAYTVIVALVGAGRRFPARDRLDRLVGGDPCAWRSASRWSASRTAARRAPRLAPLITRSAVDHPAAFRDDHWSRNPLPYPQIVEVVSYPVTQSDGATITNVQIAIIGSRSDDGGLIALVYRTNWGIAMRATRAEYRWRG